MSMETPPLPLSPPSPSVSPLSKLKRLSRLSQKERLIGLITLIVGAVALLTGIALLIYWAVSLLPTATNQCVPCIYSQTSMVDEQIFGPGAGFLSHDDQSVFFQFSDDLRITRTSDSTSSILWQLGLNSNILGADPRMQISGTDGTLRVWNSQNLLVYQTQGATKDMNIKPFSLRFIGWDIAVVNGHNDRIWSSSSVPTNSATQDIIDNLPPGMALFHGQKLKASTDGRFITFDSRLGLINSNGTNTCYWTINYIPTATTPGLIPISNIGAMLGGTPPYFTRFGVDGNVLVVDSSSPRRACWTSATAQVPDSSQTLKCTLSTLSPPNVTVPYFYVYSVTSDGEQQGRSTPPDQYAMFPYYLGLSLSSTIQTWGPGLYITSFLTCGLNIPCHYAQTRATVLPFVRFFYPAFGIMFADQSVQLVPGCNNAPDSVAWLNSTTGNLNVADSQLAGANGQVCFSSFLQNLPPENFPVTVCLAGKSNANIATVYILSFTGQVLWQADNWGVAPAT